MMLIKENHIAVAGSVSEAIRRCREYLSMNSYKAMIEVEVATFDQLEEALTFDIDRIMLDNMPVNDLIIAVRRTGGAVKLEASGNINLSNIREIAETGVDFISIGALTHSAQSLDLSLLIVD
jgi:nicotinate-nucleotide pyrophosphorylase (carboxylating)